MTSARPTIVDVAKLAGVAISSASAALNDQKGVSTETRVRVREAADSLNYVPSLRGRSLSSKRAFSIGLIVERDFTILEADPFFSAFIGGVEESLAPHGYALLLQIVDDEALNVTRHVELVDSRRVDGIILSELRADDARIPAFEARDTPVVGINPGQGFPFPAVHQDGGAAISALIAHLVELGHTRIAHVSGPAGYVHSRERLEAWKSAMLASGLSPDLIVESDFTHEGGLRAADSLLADDSRPTAVFCANDLMAIGFMNKAMELGYRVPEDVSIAGFDGISLGVYVRPTLTTIVTNPHLLGKEAARLLLEAIDGAEAGDAVIEPATFAPRGSSGRGAAPRIPRP